jgi:hypothetical protein
VTRVTQPGRLNGPGGYERFKVVCRLKNSFLTLQKPHYCARLCEWFAPHLLYPWISGAKICAWKKTCGGQVPKAGNPS